MTEMEATARETSRELGKTDVPDDTANRVGMGALKYFILKVDPKKNMTFNPKESIDFNGNTGPFIQYTHARIRSVLRKAEEQGAAVPEKPDYSLRLSEKEEGLIQLLAEFAAVVRQAGAEYNVSLVGNYAYELAKEFNQFYHDFPILREENAALRGFRLLLARNTALTIKKGMKLLGIEVPERM
jgi:arginyl-tRNA synthetase